MPAMKVTTMNADYREQLSASMDGELGKDELRFLLRRMDGDSELAPRWARYHVARQALRRHEILPLRADFADAIFARLGDEAAPTRQRLPLLRWASGGAIAAAVAVAALVVTQPGGNPGHPATDLAASGGSAGSARGPLVNQPAAAAPASVTRIDATAPAAMPSIGIPAMTVSSNGEWSQPGGVDQRLTPYLIRHYQATGQAGPSNVVPYVLLASPVAVPAEASAAAGGKR